MSLSLITLALTGVGLYYLSSESAQLFASLLHMFLGMLLFSGFVWHYYHCRKIRVQSLRRHRS